MGSVICFSTENLSNDQVASIMRDRSILSIEASYGPSELPTESKTRYTE